MDGRRLARLSLFLDALYCAAIGGILIALRERAAQAAGVPGPVVVSVGAGVISWAIVVVGAAIRPDWRTVTIRIAFVNAVAAAILAGVAALHPARTTRIVSASLALEVAAFAGAQVAGLLWGERDTKS